MPIADSEIESLADLIAYRGPDGRGCINVGRVAFGHTLLDTLGSGAGQLLRHREGVMLVADARIDGQAELRRELAALGREIPRDAGDAALIAESYLAWGEQCVEHLIGDFAFAIWDTRRGALFCARDHFGVKPFFHALTQRRLVFGNTLAGVLGHPDVADTLDELAIADFLLVDTAQEPDATAYADIRRLPPAHCLSWCRGRMRTWRYWSLPHREPGELVDADEGGEEFLRLFGHAVADRVRERRVGVLMSGGLDSPAIAWAALRQRTPEGACVEVKAHTAVYDKLFPDEERRYSGMVAEALGIPIEYRPGDRYRLFERHEALGRYFPEPHHKPLGAMEVDLARQAAQHARVVLTGWDGDTLLNEPPRPYFRYLLARGRFATFGARALRYALAERNLLPALRRTVIPAATAPAPRCPSWVAPDLARRWNLADRMALHGAPLASDHPVRPYAFRCLEFVQRQSGFFDFYDPGRTGEAVEFRHPFLDVRVVSYCLALSPYPWCRDKSLLRRAMKGALPEAVRRRPKTPLAGWPHLEALQRDESRWVNEYRPCAESARFVDRAQVPSTWKETDPDRAWTNLRPLSLDLWLRNPRPALATGALQ